ncbi:uncharacterized protein LOC114299321 isoform X4 [Camellia sinensis]|uniref:uncharacterized protein LOC114299321 isoform X4 n=1 Tax=Camellia sinensis TaxID=4442 RepID=UPI001035D81A|nr:uncharacterized protein LOC114299321 isoform X4 [Camellia sinensis]
MYDGKLINLISKKKGKNVDASNSLCSIRQERVQVAINEGKGPFWLDPACVNESPVEDKTCSCRFTTMSKIFFQVYNVVFPHLQTRNAIGLVAPAITAGLGALRHTMGTLVPVIGASGFVTATVATVTIIGTIIGNFS